jgi:hypothetical protein
MFPTNDKIMTFEGVEHGKTFELTSGRRFRQVSSEIGSDADIMRDVRIEPYGKQYKMTFLGAISTVSSITVEQI